MSVASVKAASCTGAGQLGIKDPQQSPDSLPSLVCLRTNCLCLGKPKLSAVTEFKEMVPSGSYSHQRQLTSGVCAWLVGWETTGTDESCLP